MNDVEELRRVGRRREEKVTVWAVAMRARLNEPVDPSHEKEQIGLGNEEGRNSRRGEKGWERNCIKYGVTRGLKEVGKGKKRMAGKLRKYGG